MRTTEIENIKHTDDNEYNIDFLPNFSPVFYILEDNEDNTCK